MQFIPTLFAVSCVMSSMLYAAEVNVAAEEYSWHGRFNESLEQARLGNTEAQFSVGEMYEKGSGVAADLKEAFTWFELAAKHEHKKAQFKIAYMYFIGQGVDIHPTKAFELMERLAKTGYARAQYYLALMYETAPTATRNLELAHLWYSRAAEGGYAPAKQALADNNSFPAQNTTLESKLADPVRPQPKNVPKVKALAATSAAPAQNTIPITPAKNLNLPTAITDPVAAAPHKEVAHETQSTIGLSAAHRDLPTPPLTMVAGLQPATQMQPTTAYSTLTNGSWVSQENLPVEFLPSKSTSCVPSNERGIECVSKELVRTIGKAEIAYKTHATVYELQPTGEFKVIYLINISTIRHHGGAKHATEQKRTTEQISAEPELKRGLEETEHRLECKLQNERTIQCVENQTQKIMISNQSER